MRNPRIGKLHLLARHASMHNDEVMFVAAMHLITGTDVQRAAALELFEDLKNTDVMGLAQMSEMFLDLSKYPD